VYHPGMKKYELPYCLSIVILKLKDLVFEHPNLKKEQKFDVENVKSSYDFVEFKIVNYEMFAASEMSDIQDA
jgi:hypothetical protein